MNGVAVVTGAGRGIGAATAHKCAATGAAVAVLDIDATAAAETAAEIQARHDVPCVGIECDVSADEDVRLAFDKVESTLGVVRYIVANAGIEINQPLHMFDQYAWQRIIDVNLTGVFLTCREGISRFVQHEIVGSLVCTSSPSAFVGFSGGGNSAYAASKGGISAFVRSVALDYAATGIRINAVVAGATDTGLLNATGRPDQQLGVHERARTQIPLGRLAHPDEIAEAIWWLLSESSSYVTGTNLVCDGGLMAKSANDF